MADARSRESQGTIQAVTISDDERIAQRYPKRSIHDYVLFGGLGLAVAVSIFTAVWAGIENSSPPVAGEVRNFVVNNPNEISVDLVIQREDPSQPVECSVYAQAESYEEVGEDVLQIPPGTKKLELHSFTIQTVKEAVAIEVESCHLASE